ncbi:MAG: hypothetical protein HZB50_04780 [Chloroflexi bacterium]|nr:hypothetical protein [Chloroflexota bacterium]
MKRTTYVIGLAILLAVVFTSTVLAGGWAVITLDELPGDVEANQPLEIGFMIRQHGATPLSGQSPVVRAHLVDSTKSVSVVASEKGEKGHYAATLTLPQSGKWEWAIEAFGAAQPMPALTVVAAPAPVTESEAVTSNSIPLSLLVGGVGLLGVLGSLLAFQRKVRWAAAFLVIGLLVSGVGFVSAAAQPRVEAAPEVKAVPVVSADSQVEQGRDLFIAKGCMLCHSHAETNSIREYGVDIGPNLTNLTFGPEYLRLWLKDPSSVKPATQMPTLGLSDEEIESLIMFINDK